MNSPAPFCGVNKDCSTLHRFYVHCCRPAKNKFPQEPASCLSVFVLVGYGQRVYICKLGGGGTLAKESRHRALGRPVHVHAEEGAGQVIWTHITSHSLAREVPGRNSANPCAIVTRVTQAATSSSTTRTMRNPGKQLRAGAEADLWISRWLMSTPPTRQFQARGGFSSPRNAPDAHRQFQTGAQVSPHSNEPSRAVAQKPGVDNLPTATFQSCVSLWMRRPQVLESLRGTLRPRRPLSHLCAFCQSQKSKALHWVSPMWVSACTSSS